MEIRIHYITNARAGLNIGSRNQALGVAEAFQRTYRAGAVTAKEYDLSEISQLKSALNDDKADIWNVVIAVGNDGVNALEQLPPTPVRCTRVLIGHEVPAGIEKIKNPINILAVPEHVTRRFEPDGVKCIYTQGVSHTLTEENADMAYEQWKENLSQPAIVVLLGGPVDGKSYRDDEAFKLGQYVTEKAKELNAHIYLTCSPRAEKSAIEAFNAGRGQGKECPDGASFLFIKNENDLPFKALIGLVKQSPTSRIIITGDSVNMPCEASIVPPSQLFIYPVSNQNSDNSEFVNWMHRTGHAGLIKDMHGKMIEESVENSSMAGPLSAAQQIAAAINTHIARSATTEMNRT